MGGMVGFAIDTTSLIPSTELPISNSDSFLWPCGHKANTPVLGLV